MLWPQPTTRKHKKIAKQFKRIRKKHDALVQGIHGSGLPEEEKLFALSEVEALYRKTIQELIHAE